MKTDLYTQCILERENTGNIESQVCWIPKKFAIKNKILNITIKNDFCSVTEEGWVVADVYNTRSIEEIEINNILRRDIEEVLK